VPALGLRHQGNTARLTAGGSAQLCTAGQAFYWPPGHAPEALEDTDFLEISPTRDLRALHEHVSGLGAGS
jgi:hypothetical protein